MKGKIIEILLFLTGVILVFVVYDMWSDKAKTIDENSTVQAIELDEMIRLHKDIYDKYFWPLQSNNFEPIMICLEQMKGRLRGQEVIGKGQSYEWVLIVKIVSYDGVVSVVSVEAEDEAKWPPYFDSEVKDCYKRNLLDEEWSSTESFEYSVKVPFCINPPQKAASHEK